MFNSKKQNKLPPIVDPLLLTPATKLSKQIKDGSLTSLKVCEAYIERIKQVQPLLNAITEDRFKEASDDAGKIDELLAAFRSGKPETEFTSDELEMLRSPLLGIPISVKESIMVKGMKNTCGMWQRKDSVANDDAVIIKNCQRFGMIPICTTNVPESTLFWADCQNKIYGRSLNPYDLSRITGASSGGEASLIGSGSSIIGFGSDIGGSLRNPAHYCGINSHKPSPFLVSPEGNFPVVKESRLRLFTLGPMCRYASDLRPTLKCLLNDKGNSKQDTYFKYQPKDIDSKRKKLLEKLDEHLDLSQVKIYYCDFNQSQLKGKQSLRVQSEFMDAQQELLDHFRSKFNCQVENLNLDKFMKRALITWQCLLRGGGCIDRDTAYEDDELLHLFNIDNMALELFKMPFGLSKHTKESLVAVVLGSKVPRDRERAFPLCEQFEKYAAEQKDEIENVLGDNGILIMPTLPTVAYKHNVSLLKTQDVRFPTIFNALQLPVTHVTMRLDKKHELPFGFSIAAKGYNDFITLTVAEEIESTFGGWVPPQVKATNTVEDNTIVEKQQQPIKMNMNDNNSVHTNQQKQQS